MRNPKISILLRAHNRPELTKRMVDSVNSQTYKNWEIIASYETKEDLKMLNELGIYNTIQVYPSPKHECFFNLYVNDLKNKVEDGFWQVVDSDNYYVDSEVLSKLVPHLTDEDEMVITQFQRKGNIKPSNELMESKIIRSGKFDMACMIIHAKHKNKAHFSYHDNADFSYAIEMQKHLKTKFIPLLMVGTDRRSRGQN